MRTIGLLLLCLPVYAETYYVSPDGDNVNLGTSWAQAWRTPAYAAGQVSAGDTVIIRKDPAYYAGFDMSASGAEGNPITWQGEDPLDPPFFTGGEIETDWVVAGSEWSVNTGAEPNHMLEDEVALTKGTGRPLNAGEWWWDSNVLYYKPTTGVPGDHVVWRPFQDGGIRFGTHSWIVFKDFECFVGQGTCVQLEGGNNNTVQDFQARWYFRGVVIEDGARNNLVKDFTVTDSGSGVYIRAASSYNTISGCTTSYNGNLPAWTSGDRGGVAIGDVGINVGNVVQNCELAYNGGPNSDPALITYQGPETIFQNNHVHHNYGSGLWATISSDRSIARNNLVENNGQDAYNASYTNISAMSVRRSQGVLFEDNEILNNWSTDDNPSMTELGPRGALEIRGISTDDMSDTRLIHNRVSGTIGGPDFLITGEAYYKDVEIKLVRYINPDTGIVER